MAVECAVISGIFLLMSVIFWRRHRIQWVWATLPLMLVPLSYFVTISVISHLMDIDVNVLAVVVVLIAAVGISCGWGSFRTASRAKKHASATSLSLICSTSLSR